MLKIAFQMDAIETIDIRGDSSFALALEASARGYDIFIYHPDHLAFIPGIGLTAKGKWVQVKDEVGNHVQVLSEARIDLTELDVILMRQDPPFDMHYITATYLLETIMDKVLVVNHPTSVRNAPEKLVATLFHELMPPTLITSDVSEIRTFRDEYQNIIVKPLYGNGGSGIFHLKPDDTNLSSLIETMLLLDRSPLMIQQYLPAVSKGDKRVIMIDGVATGAVNRVPAAGEARSNLHVGGKAEQSDLDENDYRIAEAIGTFLKEKELLFCGIDVIGGYLTEINVTSPTGLREIKTLSGIDLAVKIWDSITAKL
ncbi:MAG: glutathione synthase [Candidatus Puniceispirillales bacterium]|nr:glutathione synthase [Pseudomonadota bacterium]